MRGKRRVGGGVGRGGRRRGRRCGRRILRPENHNSAHCTMHYTITRTRTVGSCSSHCAFIAARYLRLRGVGSGATQSDLQPFYFQTTAPLATITSSFISSVRRGRRPHWRQECSRTVILVGTEIAYHSVRRLDLTPLALGSGPGGHHL